MNETRPLLRRPDSCARLSNKLLAASAPASFRTRRDKAARPAGRSAGDVPKDKRGPGQAGPGRAEPGKLAGGRANGRRNQQRVHLIVCRRLRCEVSGRRSVRYASAPARPTASRGVRNLFHNLISNRHQIERPHWLVGPPPPPSTSSCINFALRQLRVSPPDSGRRKNNNGDQTGG